MQNRTILVAGRKRQRVSASSMGTHDGFFPLHPSRLTSLLFVVFLSYLKSTKGTKPPTFSTRNIDSNETTDSHVRMNSPNRSKEKKTSAASPPSTANTPNTSLTKPKEKPSAPFPTPQELNLENSQAVTKNTAQEAKHRAYVEQVELEFINWCENTLGIYTILDIHTFEYYDYVKAMPKEDWDDDMLDNEDCTPVEDLPLIPVRGLAASREIKAGEVVIRIPLGALLSVTTTIDKDPVLTQVMGPSARQTNGWIADATDETSAFFEMPLLAVALLYHVNLGQQSPLHPYIKMLQLTEGTDSMPFLWSVQRLREEASEGVRVVARGIQKEMKNMYETVVQVLIDEHGQLFGRNDSEEWMFSREKFEWAFAMITTRHWQLPIKDLHATMSRGPKPEREPKNAFDDGSEDAGLPPASTPTDHWVEEHSVDPDEYPSRMEGVSLVHSFMAPLADLLNFGPPCTRGRYDSETHSFEITALCDFKKGQEVTFYYTSECAHIVVGAYGFMHPLVPPCPSAEEYRHRSEEWRDRAESLQGRLNTLYNALEEAEEDLDRLYDFLENSDCCLREYLQSSSRGQKRNRRSRPYDDDDDEPSGRLRHEHVRGAAQTDKDREARHGSRRGRSEF